MHPITRHPRLLVKTASAPERAKLSFGPARFEVRVGPLFGAAKAAREHEGAARPKWHSVKALAADDEVNAWDLCHHLVRNGFGVEGLDAPVFAEPDIKQRWVFAPESQHLRRLAKPCGEVEPPDSRLPSGSGYYWFSDSSHAQLAQAREDVGEPASDRVCIAHFDTGYAPLRHCTQPRHLRTDLQKNFVDDNLPDDARDITTGPFTNLGHGTGTLGILAGDMVEGVPLGGAAYLDVIPIRVANSVVLFWNSAIAQAFQYVYELSTEEGIPVHVITMSMGGVASQAWADAVNALYDLGVFIVTAAGNNFGHLPINNIVYPARFNRVVAACGVMADDRPYADLPLDIMAGNYGPDDKMETAMSAFTPNTPWARIGCSCTVDHNGAGTSSSTPQIAAAAALWIQKYRRQWEGYSQGWMRAEAVRKALFDSALKDGGGVSKRLGQGMLRAEDALRQLPASEADLQKQPEDEPGLPLFRPADIPATESSEMVTRMLELEALQLSQQSHELERLLRGRADEPRRLLQARRQFMEALASAPGASLALRGAVERKLAAR
jgi:hypothetical protein